MLFKTLPRIKTLLFFQTKIQTALFYRNKRVIMENC